MSEKSLHNRVKPLELTERIDPAYYSKDVMENEKKLGIFKTTNLEDLVKNVPNSISDYTSNGSFEYLTHVVFSDTGGMAFIRTQDVLDNQISEDGLIYVADESRHLVQKSLCNTGDLLICRTGSVGSAASIPERLDKSNVNQNITRFQIDCGLIDADYCAVFLNSKYGRKRVLREATGVIQKWINNQKIRKVKISLFEIGVQKYIGDKVRQAERLRAWAKEAESSVKRYHQALVPSQSSLNFAKRVRLVSPARMTERLDAHFYPGVVDEYLRLHQGKFKPLGKLCATIYKGQTQSETSSANSCKQITVTNLSLSFLGGTPSRRK